MEERGGGRGEGGEEKGGRAKVTEGKEGPEEGWKEDRTVEGRQAGRADRWVRN